MNLWAQDERRSILHCIQAPRRCYGGASPTKAFSVFDPILIEPSSYRQQLAALPFLVSTSTSYSHIRFLGDFSFLLSLLSTQKKGGFHFISSWMMIYQERDCSSIFAHHRERRLGVQGVARDHIIVNYVLKLTSLFWFCLCSWGIP
jgi:hypothetical protein